MPITGADLEVAAVGSTARMSPRPFHLGHPPDGSTRHRHRWNTSVRQNYHARPTKLL